jgi:hypothetical protein
LQVRWRIGDSEREVTVCVVRHDTASVIGQSVLAAIASGGCFVTPENDGTKVLRDAIAAAGFRYGPSLDGEPTLWCVECERDSGYHWPGCSRDFAGPLADKVRELDALRSGSAQRDPIAAALIADVLSRRGLNVEDPPHGITDEDRKLVKAWERVSGSSQPGDLQRYVDELVAAIFGVKVEQAEYHSVSDAIREAEQLHAFKRELRRCAGDSAGAVAVLDVDPRVAEVVSAATAVRDLDNAEPGQRARHRHAALVRLYNALDALPTLVAGPIVHRDVNPENAAPPGFAVGDVVTSREYPGARYRIDSFEPPVPSITHARVTWLMSTGDEERQAVPVELRMYEVVERAANH